MIALFVLVGIAAVVVVIYGVRYYDRQRSKTFQRLAESMNLQFSEKADISLTNELGGFHLFNLGYSRRISNILSGKFSDIPITVLDYQYTTGGGKSSHTWRQTVLAFESDKLSLPGFVLRPENLFDKIGGVFGKKDINFETASLFSKRYLLRGEDEAAIRRLFKESTLEFYERHPGLSTEGEGKRLIYYRSSKKVSADKLQSFLQEGYEVFGLFKTGW